MSSHDRLKSLLASIVPGDLESAKKAFITQARRVDASDGDTDDDDHTDPYVKYDKDAELDIEAAAQDALVDLVSQYEDYLDSQMVPGLLIGIENFVVDQGTAIKAIMHYDKDWFIHTPISYRGKMVVASKLIDKVKSYYNYDCALWDSITNGNPNTLMDISYKFSGGE